MRGLQVQQKSQPIAAYQSQVDLFQLTLFSLLPFIGGLVITPLDNEGQWLQYYPFRVGDVFLPLNTCFLLACVVQRLVSQQSVLNVICVSLITLTCSLQLPVLHSQLSTFHRSLQLDPDFIALCRWIKSHTPAGAVIISPPVEFVEFSWLTERATIAKYKLLPQSEANILEWYDRLADLSGGGFPQPTAPHTRDTRQEIQQQLTRGYKRLTRRQMRALMAKYSASYLMTDADR
jgi:hypothetical protein